MHTGQLLGSGRTADVYALDGSWVLRRYRDRTDTTDELAVMSYVAAFGFPVPRIGPPADGARRTDLVLQRLAGPTLAEALLAGAVRARDAGAQLGRLLRELHAIPPRVSSDPEDRILHLDLRPENVMLTERGPVVIDWSTAEEGPPGFDRAVSALNLARAALTSELPAAAAEARVLLAALLAEISDDGGASAADLALAATRGRRNPHATGAERDCLDDAVDLALSSAP
ncbi:Phosphotransferase enzyme family protein [Streptomyces sp. ADI96-02]|uniref:phosphotransferase n=1 Tax=unclassified Streptomyces TaxID=2593676 RepID=UPI000F54DF94|nr:phosphotransferase [Streptomyces sp. ADI96-02]RPK63107.1 Phosphotransferase enzyme family protein [Streptomyces sp. ADI96-02]